MTTYFFSIEITPTSAATNASDVAGAFAQLFTVADTVEKAETIARSTIIDYGWVVKEIQHILQPTIEQIANLDDVMQGIYQQSLIHGVGFFLDAYPKTDRNRNDPVEKRSLGMPIIDERKNN